MVWIELEAVPVFLDVREERLLHLGHEEGVLAGAAVAEMEIERLDKVLSQYRVTHQGLHIKVVPFRFRAGMTVS